jgi:O-antigen/teichoic acid export membrane protein
MPFILLPVLTRYLTVAEYGELAIFTIWISFITVFCGINVFAAADRKYFELKDDAGELAKYMYNCIVILVVSSSIVFMISIFFIDYISTILNLGKGLVLAGIVIAFFNVLIQLRLGQWQVRGRPVKFGMFLISLSLTNLVVSLILVVNLDMQIEGRVLGIFLPAAIFFTIGLLSLRKDKLLTPKFCLGHIRDAIKFGAPLIPHVVGFFLILGIDRAFISHKLGSESAGIYMVAVQFSLAVSIILNAVNKAFSPWLFNILNGDSYSEKLKVVRITYFLYILISVGVVLSFFVSRSLVNLIVGPDFTDAALLVPFLILGQGIKGFYLLVTNYMFYEKKTEVISAVTISAGLINVILLTFAIDFFGILGAAYSFIFSITIQWLLTWYLASRYVKMPWLSAVYRSDT